MISTIFRNMTQNFFLLSYCILKRPGKRLTSTLSDYEIQHNRPTIRDELIIPIAKYGGRNIVTMLPGTGIGPELMNYVMDVFKYAQAPVNFEIININSKVEDNEDFHNAVTSIKRNGVAIKSNIDLDIRDLNIVSRNVALRNSLDLYANFIHCKSYDCVPAKHQNIDIVLIRQNTECEYSMLEHETVKGVVESLKVITKKNSERLIRYAFEYAKNNGRKLIHTVHKANIMKVSDGLFLKIAKRIGKEYPEIKHYDIIIDNCSMQLIINPNNFDVIVTPNLYGTIIANILCGITGGAGLYSGRDFGNKYTIFEPGTRNKGRSMTGKNIANPVAMLNASVNLLEHLGHIKHAKLIRNSITKTICHDRIHTPDLGGNSTTQHIIERIIDYIIEGLEERF